MKKILRYFKNTLKTFKDYIDECFDRLHTVLHDISDTNEESFDLLRKDIQKLASTQKVIGRLSGGYQNLNVNQPANSVSSVMFRYKVISSLYTNKFSSSWQYHKGDVIFVNNGDAKYYKFIVGEVVYIWGEDVYYLYGDTAVLSYLDVYGLSKDMIKRIIDDNWECYWTNEYNIQNIYKKYLKPKMTNALIQDEDVIMKEFNGLFKLKINEMKTDEIDGIPF